MWATPGPVLGRNGHVYVASGNGAELDGRWDKSDSVTELSPTEAEPRLGVRAEDVEGRQHPRPRPRVHVTDAGPARSTGS